jgi:hypothetical protein
MKMPRTRLGLASATIAIFALPQVALAEYYVPPSNSAATQYTEAFPTAGGQKQVGKGGHRGGPSAVLGSRNAHRLDAHGPEGQATAEVAAETAPTTSESASVEAQQPGDEGHEPAGNGGAGAATEQATGGGPQGDAANRPVGEAPGLSATAGSSGLGSVFSQATGTSSSGDLGILLPLAILAALAWSIAYAVRRRKRPAHS